MRSMMNNELGRGSLQNLPLPASPAGFPEDPDQDIIELTASMVCEQTSPDDATREIIKKEGKGKAKKKVKTKKGDMPRRKT